MKKGNLIFALGIGLLGLLIILIACGYPKAEAYGTGVPGPGLWPICISVVMLVCSTILVLQSLKIKPEQDEQLVLWSAGSRRVYISMLILLIYVIVLYPLGFILSTTLMQFVFIQWFAKKKPYITLIISAAITLAVYFLFKLLLNVPIDFGLLAI